MQNLDLILSKILENSVELKDLIIFRKKIDLKNNLKEDIEHIKDTIVEKLKEYIGEIGGDLIENINENFTEIKEIIFGKELKQDEKKEKINTFDSLMKNLKSFSTKFEKEEIVEEIVEEVQVIMKEIVDKKEESGKETDEFKNLKIIEVNEELIMSFPLAANRCIKGLNIIFTNIDKTDEIIVKVSIDGKFGSNRSRINIINNKKTLVLETKWNNVLKIKITNDHLFLSNSLSTINCKLNNKKIDVINTNLKNIKWL